MPWVRIDENAMEHPKIGGLPDGAFRLWVQGLAYCQKFLTDGYVNAVAIKGLRAYSPKRYKALIEATLWTDAAEGGIQIHDYLDWNDSREMVLQARQDAKDRRRRYRDRHASSDANETTNVPSGVSVLSSSVFRKNKESGDDDVISERAGRFIERYQALYQKHRKGAHYLVRPHLDYPKAKELCATWDDERLDKLATVFLLTDHKFAEEGSRTIGQFAALASWCDGRLAEAGIA